MRPTRWELYREDPLGFKENPHLRRMDTKVMFETPVLYIYICGASWPSCTRQRLGDYRMGISACASM
jgi:hypothetical protein